MNSSVAAITLASALLAGCSILGPSRIDGWRVVSEGSQALRQGMVASRSDIGLVIKLTVPDGGASGCGQPRVVGVDRSGETVVVRVERALQGEQCLVTGDVTFEVEVGGDLASGATVATRDDACQFDGCSGRPVVIEDE
jgi:hypothetical protein